MLAETIAPIIAAAPDAVMRAVVIQLNEDGSVLVARDPAADRPFICDRLVTSAEPVDLAPADVVLCVSPAGPGARGVVLGRIGLSHAVGTSLAVEDGDPDRVDPRPNELLLEAKERLTLRVGDGSITIRADGKILIKGTDLVSHAKRANRIKGGAVAIN